MQVVPPPTDRRGAREHLERLPLSLWQADTMDSWDPAYLTGYPAVVERHGARLSQLVGRRLTAAWLLWAEADADVPWFCDAPVVLDFEGEQVELDHRGGTELSITWNAIDRADASRWCAADEGPPAAGFGALRWRRRVVPQLAALEGSTLDDIQLWVPLGDTSDERRRPLQLAHESIWPSFGFAHQRLTVINAGDQNGLRFGSRYRDIVSLPVLPDVDATQVSSEVPLVGDPALPSVWHDLEGVNGW